MTERPILFQGAMVRAIREGRKTQTRRIVKWRDTAPGLNLGFSGLSAQRYGPDLFTLEGQRGDGAWERRSEATRCPYGKPGDRLWVRESLGYDAEYGHYYSADRTFLCSLFDDEEKQTGYSYDCNGPALRSVPSIHLPRRYSRIALEITDVRVERLRSISEADAIAEGCAHTDFGLNQWQQSRPGWKCGDAPTGHEQCMHSAVYAYASLWDEINGAGAWNTNPWCWAVSFRLLAPNT
jgi:hypothetical protein